MSSRKQVIVELSEEQQKEIKDTFGEEFSDMIVYHDQVGRLIGEMVNSGGAGSDFAAGMRVTGGVGATEKVGLTVTDGLGGDAQANLSVKSDRESDKE